MQLVTSWFSVTFSSLIVLLVTLLLLNSGFRWKIFISSFHQSERLEFIFQPSRYRDSPTKQQKPATWTTKKVSLLFWIELFDSHPVHSHTLYNLFRFKSCLWLPVVGLLSWQCQRFTGSLLITRKRISNDKSRTFRLPRLHAKKLPISSCDFITKFCW